MSIVTKHIRGNAYYIARIWAVGERNESGRLICPALDFLSDCKSTYPIDVERLSASFEHLARNGRLDIEEKFKRLAGTDGIWEFRTRGGLRLYCFFDDSRVVICTHGIIKKQLKTPKHVISEAETWKRRYFQAKHLNQLYHEPEHT